MKGVEKFVGLTLKQVAKKCSFNSQGVTIFILKDKDDDCGERFCENHSVKLVLAKHPELAERKVVESYDFYGQDIYRVI